jgi:hypothetical protein
MGGSHGAAGATHSHRAEDKRCRSGCRVGDTSLGGPQVWRSAHRGRSTPMPCQSGRSDKVFGVPCLQWYSSLIGNYKLFKHLLRKTSPGQRPPWLQCQYLRCACARVTASALPDASGPNGPSRRKRRKIYGSDPGRKLMFFARSLGAYIDIVKSMVCTDIIAEGFWPSCVEHRHCGLRHPLFPAV